MALASDDRLEVFHSRADNTEVIVCRGWLDEITCRRLQELIDRALDDGVHRLRLDLRSLLGIDESGMQCLLVTSGRCEEFGIHLELETNRPVRAALTANGGGHLAQG